MGGAAVSYVVNWRSSDGTDGWHAAADLTAAAAHVEHLRNRDGVDGARIFELHEVPFELRPYFKVELATTPAVDTVAAPVVEPSVVEPAVAEPEPVVKPVHADESWAEAVWPESATTATEDSEPALEPVADGANGMHRRGLFGR